ncbi:MAG: phospholipase D-like domain-containing protein, partial [Salinirussus sp.]
MWRLLTVGLVCALAAPVVAGSGGAGAAWHGTVAVPEPRDDPRGPRIVGVYPNPVAAEDRGEFVVLSVPPGTESGELRLADGESNVSLPAGLPSGRVAVSSHPNRTAQLTDRPVARLPDGIALANGGEKLVLWRGGQILSRIRYSDAPEGELLDATTGQWRALGATARPVVTGGPGRVRLFVLPDAPDAAVRFLREADRRILLGGYTLTSRRVTDALAGAAARGVSVRVLVDGAPVGGVPVAQRRRLDRLAAAGVEVRALAGERARYAFHHPKYAVVDDRALVTTENWKPSGIGGRGTRGWAAITAQPRVVAGLAATFRADAGWRDAVPWEEFRDRIETGDGGRPDGQFPRRFEPARVQVRGARLLVAPDNAEGATVSLIRSARESVRIEQVSIGGRRQPFLRAALDAARRGVRVRVLLSGAWYVREENRNLTAWLERRARREGLPLEAKLADPHGRFGAIHAKGVIVDGDRAVVGSL